MIKIDNLSFSYKGSKNNVLRELNLNIEKNKICGLLGKNGVGKSTLLYLISGLLRPTKGTVTTLGFNASDHCVKMLQDFFIVAEEFELPATTLSAYIKANSMFYPHFSEELMRQCLSDFEMEGEYQLHKLSMGQKKKVYISFALATGTSLLVMDEPTNGLDIPSKAQFRKAVSRSMTEDRTIIISTHQVHDIDLLLDHVVIMSNEGILLNESTEELCNKYVFEYRSPQDMDDVVYAEPSLQGNAVMAHRGNREETALNLELLFNAVTLKK